MSQDGGQELTLMFVDIPAVISQAGGGALPQSRAEVERCFSVLKSVQTRHGGTFAREIGNTFVCCFDTPAGAVQAACEMQQAASTDSAAGTPGLGVRIALHAGVPVMRNGMCTGEVMTTAARLVTVAEPGQIITTDRVTESLSGAAEAQVREAPNAANMEKRLQVRLFQICWGSATPAADSSDGLESGGAAEAVDGGGEEAPQPTSASGSGKGVPPSEAPAPSREGSLVDIGLDATEVLDLSALRAKDERRKTGATAIDESARAEAQRVTDESAPAGASSSEPTLCLIWRGQVLSIRSEEEAIHLGREDENEVVLDGDTASRLHAHLERRGDTFMLVDYSTNGTFVYDSEGNQKRIKEDQVELDTSGAISPGCPQDAVGSDPILFWVTGGKA